jgi:hypothetical protein
MGPPKSGPVISPDDDDNIEPSRRRSLVMVVWFGIIKMLVRHASDGFVDAVIHIRPGGDQQTKKNTYGVGR